VLVAGGIADAIVEALRSENEGVATTSHGSYVRVSAPGRLRLSRGAVEAVLGRPFRLPSDLEPVMPSFAGRLRVDEDEACWEAPPPHAAGGAP
jgi:hypothetical protein